MKKNNECAVSDLARIRANDTVGEVYFVILLPRLFKMLNHYSEAVLI